jgi:uncharacterized protein (DUF2147 family)
MTDRPVRTNTNHNPAQVILDATQKQRTTSQKQADEALAAKAKSTQAKTIATAKDKLRQEDEEYGTNQLETLTIAEQMKSGKGKAKQKGNEGQRVVTGMILLTQL